MKTEKISVQKICMIAFAICINFVGGQIALFLKLPIYLTVLELYLWLLSWDPFMECCLICSAVC